MELIPSSTHSARLLEGSEVVTRDKTVEPLVDFGSRREWFEAEAMPKVRELAMMLINQDMPMIMGVLLSDNPSGHEVATLGCGPEGEASHPKLAAARFVLEVDNGDEALVRLVNDLKASGHLVRLAELVLAAVED